MPPPNGGHGSLFPAVCRGAPIPIVMLSHTYGSTAMPCVCVDNLYHYHFIEEPRMRLPHPHPLAHECVQIHSNSRRTHAPPTADAVPFCRYYPLGCALIIAQYFYLYVSLGRVNNCPAYSISRASLSASSQTYSLDLPLGRPGRLPAISHASDC